MTAVLRPDEEQESPHESHERQLFLSSLSHTQMAAIPKEITNTALRASIGLLQGKDPIAAIRLQFPQVRFEAIGTTGVQFVIPNWAEAPQYLEVLRPGCHARHIALPLAPGQRGLVVIKRLVGSGLSPSWDDISIEAHLQDNQADLLFFGLGRGYLREASEVLDGSAVTAERLLEEKIADPLGAAVGAYSLLQFGELDRLHNWTENLMNWFPWLPDGLAIRGEHLARTGRHLEALQAFIELPSRGVPLFGAGLSYAINRLKLYAQLTPDMWFGEDIVSKAKGALEYFDQICRHVDFRRPLLETDGIRDDAQYPLGMEISSYLSSAAISGMHETDASV